VLVRNKEARFNSFTKGFMCRCFVIEPIRADRNKGMKNGKEITVFPLCSAQRLRGNKIPFRFCL
jgi:hypothetical protein